MDYWELTTNAGQRFVIPANYEGERCLIDVIKAEGAAKVSLIAVSKLSKQVKEALNGR